MTESHTNEPTVDLAPQFSVFDNPTQDEISSVVSAMRREDREECAAWGLDPRDVVAGLTACDFKWVVYQRQYPVFIFGLKQHLPDSYYLCGFAAGDMEDKTFVRLTRWGIKTWLPIAFYQLNVRRIEAIVPVQSVHSLNWLTWLGMQIEGRSKDYVKRGDSFLRLSYTISDYEETDTDVHVSTTEGRSRPYGSDGGPDQIEYAGPTGNRGRADQARAFSE